jgi:hypothetical protein
MDGWMTALVGAAGVLAGSGLTGLLAGRQASREREAQDLDELRTALAAYGAAVDAVELRMAQMGGPMPRVARWIVGRVERHLRIIAWLIRRMSATTISWPVFESFDRLALAKNRLLLIAPTPVVDAAVAIDDLIWGFESNASGWQREWREARETFLVAARDAVGYR